MDSPLEGRDVEVAASPTTTALTLGSARPLFTRSPASNPNFSSLPPLLTQIPSRSAAVSRNAPLNKRLSTISAAYDARTDSRPHSTVFPFFLSSLQYALVRDFAYAAENPLHYGPTPENPSSATTTASEFNQRMADAMGRGSFGSADVDTSDAAYFGLQIPSRKFGDGPPYAEDEDLLSPIVTTTRHKKNRSSTNEVDASRSGHSLSSLGRHAQAAANEDHRQEYLAARSTQTQLRDPIEEYRDGTPELHDGDSPSQSPSENYEDDYFDGEESRFSKHYQFSIASPDEEYHGKAVALFDFARENDNELPFSEGQVLYISYRHGEGWLVAQDPRSGESGLVPEQYVRLLRDIEGGLSGLHGDVFDPDSPAMLEADTPTEAQHQRSGSGTDANGRYFKPVVSSFSTSSKDLEPYQLGNSQQNTPTAPSRHVFDQRETFPPEILGAASFQQGAGDDTRAVSSV